MTATPSEIADLRARLFAKSVPDQLRLAQIRHQLGGASSGLCLDVAVSDGAYSRELRRLPGRWATVCLDPAVAEDLRRDLPEDSVLTLEDGRLPYPDQSFDFVVLPDVLPAVEDDYAFVRECHRVLKPRSYLIATTPNLKPFSLSRGLRRLLGMSELKRGFLRPGYTERHLYDLFKDGFDMVESHAWSHFFLESAQAVTQVLLASALGGVRPGAGGPEEAAALTRAHRVLRLCHPFVRVAAAFDRLLRFTRGHQRIAQLKTRMWIPRREVKIRDGRSIADATVNTRIGTAKEF
jgi:SAM-dependent methyltransferase